MAGGKEPHIEIPKHEFSKVSVSLAVEANNHETIGHVMLNLCLGIFIIILGILSVLLKDYSSVKKYPYIKYILPSILIIVGTIQIYVSIDVFCEAQKEKAINANTGTLARTYILEPHKNIYPQLEIGNSGAIFIFGGTDACNTNASIRIMENLFKINGLIIYTDHGIVTLSAKFRNAQGKLVAKIIQNEWKHKPLGSDVIWDRNYSDDAIEVKDGKGCIVLQVRLLTDRIQLQGIFHNEDGRGLALYESNSEEYPGGLFNPNVTADNYPDIKPIFKYSSNKYLGVLSPSK